MRAERAAVSRRRWSRRGARAAAERVAQAPDDQAAHQAGIAEADLGLGRVDVDVDLGRVELDVEGGDRMAVAGQEVGVGGAQRAVQQPVAHRAAVDEQILGGALPRL